MNNKVRRTKYEVRIKNNVTRLSDIIGEVETTVVFGTTDRELTSLQSDSRTAEPGCLFFAIRGTGFDGHDFIPQAVEKGATAVVCQTLPENPSPDVTWIVTNNSARALGYAASAWFGHPSQKLELVGVTGTNGKTTSVTLLFGMVRRLGFKAGLISTILNRIEDEEIVATHTTPDPIQLNGLIARMVEAGCRYCFMEVSSHAVDQQRIAGLMFRGGIFTNLTHDHLDYHKTFDAYLAAKKAFFDGLPQNAFALVNRDDRNGMVMVQNCRARIATYSLRSMADFRCRILENRFEGLQLEIDGSECWFRLIGSFNAYNLLGVYAAGCLLGLEKTSVLTALSELEPVNGRFNYVISPSNVKAIVDYAHTPDALQNVLETIQNIRTKQEQLITVVGAGGNRDAAKRPVMASIACEFSDRVILTSDNPRFEDPEAILAGMRKGVEPQHTRKVLVIVNREEAIRTAVALAQPGDILLVAGKGHETYQEIRGVRHPFDDRMILRGLFETESTQKQG